MHVPSQLMPLLPLHLKDWAMVKSDSCNRQLISLFLCTTYIQCLLQRT